MKNITEEYVIGEKVICRKYIKTMGTKFNVNFRFRIVKYRWRYCCFTKCGNW